MTEEEQRKLKYYNSDAGMKELMVSDLAWEEYQALCAKTEILTYTGRPKPSAASS